MQKITPFLWFNNNAEAAAKFYVSIFSHKPGGAEVSSVSPMIVNFELTGQKFIALNGGPIFKFNEAVSFYVDCIDQQEIDELWEKLSEGGQPGQCGWLKDQFGLSWQIVPAVLKELLDGKEPGKADRVMKALLKMTKIDIETLKQA